MFDPESSSKGGRALTPAKLAALAAALAAARAKRKIHCPVCQAQIEIGPLLSQLYRGRTSPAKARASAINGKLGGRPKKSPPKKSA